MSLTDLTKKTRGPYSPPQEDKLWGVFYLNKHGISQSAIAKTIELPKSTVQTIVTRIQKTGSPLPKKSPGAQKKINERALRQIERVARKNPSVKYDDLRLHLEGAGINVCRGTVIAALKEIKP